MILPPRYWTGKPLFDLGLPWLTPGAIESLFEIVKPTDNVLEFGAGGSTIFFSKRCASVMSWELNKKWRKQVLARCGPNVTIALSLFAILDYPGPFDIVLVDNLGDRQRIAETEISKVSENGCFILDNYARYRIDFLRSWRCRFYDDPYWSGKGTLIATR